MPEVIGHHALQVVAANFAAEDLVNFRRVLVQMREVAETTPLGVEFGFLSSTRERNAFLRGQVNVFDVLLKAL